MGRTVRGEIARGDPVRAIMIPSSAQNQVQNSSSSGSQVPVGVGLTQSSAHPRVPPGIGESCLAIPCATCSSSVTCMILRGHRKTMYSGEHLSEVWKGRKCTYVPVTAAIWVSLMAECVWARLSAKEGMYFRVSMDHKIHEIHTLIEAVQSQVGRSQHQGRT